MKLFFSLLLLLSLISFSLVLVCSTIEGNEICDFLVENYLYFGSGSIHVGLFSAAMYFLWKKDLKTTIRSIGFPGGIISGAVFSITGFIMVICVLFALGITAYYLNFSDQSAVYDKVAELPIYILAFAVLFAPVSEELFFRAFLVPRTGVIISSFLFGIMHFSYGSVVEVIGAAFIGLVLALVYKASKSITPCLAIHLMYNLMSITAMLTLREFL